MGKHFDDYWIGEPNSGCWLWVGAVSSRGYGNFRQGVSQVRAHRHSYVLANGPISKDLVVCHKCDTPLCVNPAHLFLGTHTDNMKDKAAKSRQSRGEAHRLAKLNEKQVAEMRASQLSRPQLVAKYGVSRHTIKQVLNRITWKHVT